MKRLFVILGLSFFVFSFSTPITVGAAYNGAFSEVCKSSEAKATNSSVCDAENQAKTKNPATETIGNVVTLVSFAAGVAAVIFIIFGGFKFVISNGDPAKVTSARQTIVYSLVGLIVIVSSNLIIQFVISNL